jgi:hypothetical protein
MLQAKENSMSESACVLHDGLTKGQIDFRRDPYSSLEKQILDIEIMGTPAGVGEEKKLLGDQKPNFSNS